MFEILYLFVSRVLILEVLAVYGAIA